MGASSFLGFWGFLQFNREAEARGRASDDGRARKATCLGTQFIGV